MCLAQAPHKLAMAENKPSEGSPSAKPSSRFLTAFGRELPPVAGR